MKAKSLISEYCEWSKDYDGLRLEWALEAYVTGTEGTTAFMEKRKPVYKGK